MKAVDDDKVVKMAHIPPDPAIIPKDEVASVTGVELAPTDEESHAGDCPYRLKGECNCHRSEKYRKLTYEVTIQMVVDLNLDAGEPTPTGEALREQLAGECRQLLTNDFIHDGMVMELIEIETE